MSRLQQPGVVGRLQYWLGVPCRYNEKRQDLAQLPDGDLGGREVTLPENVPPEALFDETMPFIFGLHQQEQKKAQFHPSGVMSASGWLAQAVQMLWCFMSREFVRLQSQLVVANQHIAQLEGRLRKLEEGDHKAVDVSEGDA